MKDNNAGTSAINILENVIGVDQKAYVVEKATQAMDVMVKLEEMTTTFVATLTVGIFFCLL